MATRLREGEGDFAVRDGSAARWLSVGVVVDLYRYPGAGGHVKCWERLAEAAVRESGLDLTVYFFGRQRETIQLAQHVRYELLPPIFPTDRLAFLGGVADHTDLAPGHSQAGRLLQKHQVIHTTDTFFSMARTALRRAKKNGTPLVCSLHTDMALYTRIYSGEVLRRIFGRRLGRTVVDQWRWNERLAARMQHRLERYLAQCDWTLLAEEVSESHITGSIRSSRLRRGLDKELFHPSRQDRARLQRMYGIPTDCPVVLFVGRVDAVKSAMTLAAAVRRLLDHGVAVHAIFAGKGSQREAVGKLLAGHVSLPGNVPQDELAWLYASADVFALPSETEIFPNAVLEARSSGLPVVVSAAGGSAQLVTQPGVDGIVVQGGNPAEWAQAVGDLIAAPARRTAMGAAARRQVEAAWPSWHDVLVEDLLPVWQRVARERGVCR